MIKLIDIQKIQDRSIDNYYAKNKWAVDYIHQMIKDMAKIGEFSLYLSFEGEYEQMNKDDGTGTIVPYWNMNDMCNFLRTQGFTCITEKLGMNIRWDKLL